MVCVPCADIFSFKAFWMLQAETPCTTFSLASTVSGSVKISSAFAAFSDHLMTTLLEATSKSIQNTPNTRSCANPSMFLSLTASMSQPLRNRSPMQLEDQLARSSPRRCEIKPVTT